MSRQQARKTAGKPAKATLHSPAAAQRFVRSIRLPKPPPPRLGAAKDLTRAPAFSFDVARDQAAVVGSDVISFVKGVTPEQRNDIVNASLLAQLVANKKIAQPKTLSDVVDWYEEYLDVLSHVGFVIQDKGFAEYEERSKDFEAHKAILDIATVLLAGAPAALAVVKATLGALEKMAGDSPWITLFNRESRSAKTARFQVSLVDGDPSAQLLLTLIAFGLEARTDVTQVLFFKFGHTEVKLQHHSGKVTIDAPVLASVRGQIADKLLPFVSDYIAGLPDLKGLEPGASSSPAGPA
jgi:hypothetical protein